MQHEAALGQRADAAYLNQLTQSAQTIEDARSAPLHHMPRTFDFSSVIAREEFTGEEFKPTTISEKMPSLVASLHSEKPRAEVIHAPAGTGKTYQAIRAVCSMIRTSEIDPDRMVLHLVPTHKLAEETKLQYDDQNVSAMVYAGQSNAEACRRSDAAVAVADVGLYTKDLCGSADDPEKRCPFFESCTFRETRKVVATDAPSVLIAPVEYLRSGGLPEEAKRPVLVLIDESVHETMIRHDAFPTRKFGNAWSKRVREDGEHEDTYKLLAALRNDVLTAVANAQAPEETLINRYSSAKGLMTSIKKIIDLRYHELRATVGGVGASTTAAQVRNARIPQYYRRELQLWHSLQSRVEATIKGQPKASWIALREDDSIEEDDVKEGYFDIIDRLPFPAPAPVLILDASADEGIYRALFGQSHEVRYTTYARPRDTLERTAIVGLSCSKSSLVRSYEDTTNKGGRNYEKERQKRIAKVSSALDAIGKREGDRSILLVAAKSVIEAIKSGEIGAEFMKTRDVVLAHFGSLRGLNEHREVMTTIILGKLEPDDAAARRIAAGFSESPENVLAEMPERTAKNVQIALRDGKAGEITTSIYRCPDTSRAQYQIREEDVVQAEQRTRAARRYGEDIRSYIIGDAIPETFRFDHIYSIHDFERSKLEQVSDANDGCLSAAGYAAQHGTTAQSAGTALKDRGFIKSAAPAGWTAWKVKRTGARGAPGYVYTRGTDDTTEARVAEHFATFKDLDAQDLTVLLA